MGELDEARRQIEEARALTEKERDAWGEVLCPSVEAYIAALAGERVAARGAAALAHAAIERHESWSFDSAVHHIEGLAAFGLGMLEEARAHHDRSVAEADRSGYHELIANFLAGLGDTALAQADLAVASDCFGHCDEIARAQGDGYSQACAARGLSRLAVAEGDLGRAETLAHEALVVFAAREARLDVAQTLDLLAAIPGHEQPDRAVRLHACAYTTRLTSGAINPVPFADAVTKLLTSLRQELGDETFDAAWAEGERMSWQGGVGLASRGRGRRRRPPAGWASLTPAERDVAHLVADGLTNQEIADRLYVTTNTVKTHLTHLFAKLQTRSRAGVATAVARNLDGDRAVNNRATHGRASENTGGCNGVARSSTADRGQPTPDAPSP
jgi:DNA-binding CsgD family transcriptional regulator/tetratricopeptide (TPR) repeat protein